MKSKLPPTWLPFAFCAGLCAIALVADLAMRFASPNADSRGAWQPAFFCFLPMAFWFAGNQEQASRQRIAELESRVRDLEAARAA